MSVNDGLEGIIGFRGLGGETLAAVSYALRPNIRKLMFCGNGVGSRVFVVCFLHISCQICFYETPGPPTPQITDRGVSTVTPA